MSPLRPVPHTPRVTGTLTLMEGLGPWLAGLLLASPVLLAYYPPMTDLPLHEAAVGILRHFDDTSMFPPGLYVRNFGHPNQLFHLVSWGLSQVVSTRWAVKLVVAAAVAAVPVCAARFARHAGASPLAAVLVAPMALGWLFAWGLIANILGLSAFLLVVPVLDRFARAPTWRGSLGAVAPLALLYFAHEAMMFVYTGLALALAALHRWSWRETTLRLTPFLAGVAITLAQLKWQQRFMTPAVLLVPTTWNSVVHKLVRVPYLILPEADDLVQLAMLALCVFTIGSFFWLRGRERRELPSQAWVASSSLESVRSWAIDHRWELFATGCFVTYLSLPTTFHGATLVYQRWFPPAFAVLAVVAAPRDLSSRVARVPLIALATLPIATLVVALPSFIDSSRQYRFLDEIMSAIEPGSAVSELNVSGDPRRSYSLASASGRVLATRGGRLAYAFTDSPISPVILAREYQWNESLLRLGVDPWDFLPQRDFKSFRYVIVHSADAATIQLVALALQREAELLAEAGDWVLFRSRSVVVPPRSREEPLVMPPPQNLRQRVFAVQEQLKAASKATLPSEPAKR